MTYPEKFDWVFNHGAVAYRLNTTPREAMYYTSHKFKPTEIVIDKSTLGPNDDHFTLRKIICDAINREGNDDDKNHNRVGWLRR